MARLSLLNNPLLLGFDEFERSLERAAKASTEGYPPYNIEQLGNERLRITLAVAGFRVEDLEIHLEDNQLIVRGRQTDDSKRVYLHRGIAARQFQRSFILAEGIEVDSATLDSGLLHINLVRPQPKRNARRIEIAAAKAGEAVALSPEHES